MRSDGKKSHYVGKRPEVTLSKLRSALTNGSTVLLGDFDPRSAWMRRLKDLIQNHVSDLGGEDVITEAELRLARAGRTQGFLNENGRPFAAASVRSMLKEVIAAS